MLFDIIEITNTRESKSLIDKIRVEIQMGNFSKELEGEDLIRIDNFINERTKVFFLKGNNPIHDTFYNLLKIIKDFYTMYVVIHKGDSIQEFSPNLITVHNILGPSEDKYLLEKGLRDIYMEDNDKEDLTHIKIKYLQDKRYGLVSTEDLKLVGAFTSLEEIEGDKIRLRNGVVDTNKFPPLLEQQVSDLFGVKTKFIDDTFHLDDKINRGLLVIDRYDNRLVGSIKVIEQLITNSWKDESNIGVIDTFIYT